MTRTTVAVVALGAAVGAYVGFRAGTEFRGWLDAVGGIGCAPDDALTDDPDAGETLLDRNRRVLEDECMRPAGWPRVTVPRELMEEVPIAWQDAVRNAVNNAASEAGPAAPAGFDVPSGFIRTPAQVAQDLKEFLACGCPCHPSQIPGACQCCAVGRMKGVTTE